MTKEPLNQVTISVTFQVDVARRRSSRRSTATPQKDQNQDTEASEYLPSQIVHLPRESVSPTLRKRTSKKRKSSFGVVIPPFKPSSDTDSRKEKKEITPEAAKWSSVEPSVEPEQPSKGPKPKKRRLVRKVIEDSQEEQLKSTGILVQDPIVITSSRSQSEELPAPSEKSPIPIEAKSPPAPSSHRQSRSRDRTPSQPARNRSLSPVTKVDSWLSIASDNDFEEAFKDHEHPLQVDMNSNTPLAPGFTPIQTIHRQVTQSNIIQAGSPLLNASRPMQPRRTSSISITLKRTNVRPLPTQHIRLGGLLLLISSLTRTSPTNSRQRRLRRNPRPRILREKDTKSDILSQCQ